VTGIFRKMEREGFIPNTYTYSILIKIYAAHVQGPMAYKTLKLMEKSGITPTIIHYTSLIRAFSRNRKTRHNCWRIWNHMRHSGVVKPDEVAYSLMIHVAAQQTYAEKAIVLFNEMVSNNMQPTETTYNSVIAACAMRKDYYIEMFTYLKRMKAAGFVADKNTFTYLLKGASINGDIKTMKIILQDMEAENIKIDSKFHVQILSTYATAVTVFPQHIEFVLRDLNKTYEEFIAKFKKECSFRDKALAQLVRGYVKAKKINMALEIYTKTHTELAVTPTEEAFDWMVTGLFSVERFDEVKVMIEAQRKVKTIKPLTYRIALTYLVKADYINSALSILRSAAADGNPISGNLPSVQELLRKVKLNPDYFKEVLALTIRKPRILASKDLFTPDPFNIRANQDKIQAPSVIRLRDKQDKFTKSSLTGKTSF